MLKIGGFLILLLLGVVGELCAADLSSRQTIFLDDLNNVVSTANSSTTPLTSGSSFTGTFQEVLKYSHLIILVFADEVSATDGLEIQWSTDGTNIDDTDNFTIPANNGKVFSFAMQAKYVRVKYTNGATGQAAFRLQTLLKILPGKGSTHRLNDNLSGEDDAEIVKAIISGDDGTGTFMNAKVDGIGRLLVSDVATTPLATTEVVQTAQTSTNGSVDTIYTITNGSTLTIQLFQAGAEANSIGGSKVELFEDPEGDLSPLTLISAVYINGSSFQNNITSAFTGDGTRRIVMRRTALAGSAREIFGRWKGYEE